MAPEDIFCFSLFWLVAGSVLYSGYRMGKQVR